MIEGGRAPTIRSVAQTALLPQLALVRIVFGMAGATVLRGGLEDEIRMASVTGQADVFTG